MNIAVQDLRLFLNSSISVFIVKLEELQKNWFYLFETKRWSLRNINQDKGEIYIQVFQEAQVYKIENIIQRIISIVSKKIFISYL